MKKFTTYFAGTLVIFIISFSANAQILNKIKNAASRGVERAVEKKVEEETNKLVQRQIEKQLEGLFDSNGEDGAVGLDLNKMMKGLGEEVPTADKYEFSGNVIMQIISTDEKGKTADPMKIKSFLTKSSDYTGMEVSDTEKNKSLATMIFDVTNQASIIIMDNDGQKSSLAYKLDFNALTDSLDDRTIEEQMKDEEILFEKTGKTKDILGYSCEEFHVKSEDGEGFYWMTEEPIGGYTSLWGSNSPFMTDKNKEKYAASYKNLPKGNFMELYFTSSDGSKVDMTVVEINESAPITYQMSDYPNIFKTAQANQ